jgi:hypothetical protein
VIITHFPSSKDKGINKVHLSLSEGVGPRRRRRRRRREREVEIENEEIRVNYSCGESKHAVVEASCCDRGRIVEQENAQRLSNNNKAIFAISLFGLCWNMVTLRGSKHRVMWSSFLS